MKAGPWACESACRQFMRPGAPLFSVTGSYSEEVFLLYYLIKEPDRGDLLTLEGLWVIREGEWWEVISNMASMILASWSSCHYLISSHRKWTKLPYLLLSNRIRHEWCVLQLRLDLKQTNKLWLQFWEFSFALFWIACPDISQFPYHLHPCGDADVKDWDLTTTLWFWRWISLPTPS